MRKGDRPPAKGRAGGKDAPRRPPLPDEAARRLIREELDSCLLVEAAAGTGKTKSMVDRMVALVAKGAAEPAKMAAVTFTRKAAAELRSRFQAELAAAARLAAGPEKERLDDALTRVEECFIGTIHSFCARLLRERPVEAGVSVDFREMDDVEDAFLRDEAWEEHVAGLHGTGSSMLVRLARAGLRIGDLKGAYATLADHPDVTVWPASDAPMPDLASAARALEDYARHMERAGLPPYHETPRDKLMAIFRKVPRMVRQADLGEPADLMAVLGEFKALELRNLTQGKWPGAGDKAAKDRAKAEFERYARFREEHAAPLNRVWLEHRYGIVLEAVRPALGTYDRRRSAAGRLNYQDLLVGAARLLREHPNVREYFAARCTRVLVDEFQDTDPVQAEVLLLLAADYPGERDWRKCRPRPGALFVVGDPKQSIYRFRRADIVTYGQVREIIERSGGRTVKLSTNFRSRLPVLEWVNRVFAGKFPAVADEASPAYVPLLPVPGAGAGPEGHAPPIGTIAVPEGLGRKDSIIPWEAGFIARTIAAEVEAGRAGWGDFMIVTRNTKELGDYSRALRERGVPHEVTGGAALNQVRELALLRTCLAAVLAPENPVALAAALRGELFGFGDDALYRYRLAGGSFNYRAPVPESLPVEDAAPLADAFGRLSLYHRWFSRMPPVAALELIAADLGLVARAASSPGGNVEAGSLVKAFEVLRAAQFDFWTSAELAEYLGLIVDDWTREKLDGLPALPHGGEAVRVMNLHKVKGLEAGVIFLADPTGEKDHGVELHVDRSGGAGEARGYMAVRGPSRSAWGTGPLLAQPPAWDAWEAREKAFVEAEGLRLLYVAATRARHRLVVTMRTGGRKAGNPWQFFEEFLGDAPALAEPAVEVVTAPAAPAAGGADRLLESAAAAREAIERRWSRAAVPTYDVKGVKEAALGAPEARERREGAPPPGEGEHGTEWGSVIHMLLQAAMDDPKADVVRLARAALEEHDLDPGLAGEAVETVSAVMKSEIWRRASAAPARLTEVPFQVFLRPGEKPAERLPLILRGVIDLAFREKAGWIIVDYKTDDREGRPVDHLVEKYAPQVKLYADEWSRLTGEPVSAAFLLFVHTGRLEPVEI